MSHPQRKSVAAVVSEYGRYQGAARADTSPLEAFVEFNPDSPFRPRPTSPTSATARSFFESARPLRTILGREQGRRRSPKRQEGLRLRRTPGAIRKRGRTASRLQSRSGRSPAAPRPSVPCPVSPTGRPDISPPSRKRPPTGDTWSNTRPFSGITS